MIEVRHTLVIRRPIEQVFAFVSDVENLPRWAEMVTDARRDSNGPLQVGTTFRVTTHALGKHTVVGYTVTEYDPPRAVSVASTVGPLQMENRYTFEPVEGGTRLTVTSRGTVRGLPRLVESLIAGSVRRQFEADHMRLKTVLESNDEKAV